MDSEIKVRVSLVYIIYIMWTRNVVFRPFFGCIIVLNFNVLRQYIITRILQQSGGDRARIIKDRGRGDVYRVPTSGGIIIHFREVDRSRFYRPATVHYNNSTIVCRSHSQCRG